MVHFNNLRLYQRRQEEAVDTPANGGIGNASPVEGIEGKRPRSVLEGGEEVVVSTDGEESELMDGEGELSMQHPATPEICGSQSDDVIHPSCVETDVERDHSVEAPGTEGSDLVVDTQMDAAIPQEGSCKTVPANPIGEEEGSKHDDERAEEESALQSQRPVRMRIPPDRYGEWILNSLQQIADSIRTLEDKQSWKKTGLRN